MKRILAVMLSLLFVCLAFSGCGEDKLTDGSLVQLGTYGGEPILWRVYAQNDGTAYLLSEKIISVKAFDAFGAADVRGTARGASGANDWENSALCAWLNTVGEVTYQYAPERAKVYGGLNAYDTEPGFLTDFTEKEIKLLLAMERTNVLAQRDKERATVGTAVFERKNDLATTATAATDVYSNTVSNRVALLDIYEAAAIAEKDSSLLIAGMSEYAKNNTKGHNNAEALGYWLQTPNGASEFAQCMISATGTLSDAEPRNSCIGVRPIIALNAKGSAFVGAGTAEDPFCIKE